MLAAARLNWAWYRRWILANGIAELVGLGTTALLGSLLFRSLGDGPTAWRILVGTALIVAAGTLFGGA